MSWAWQNRVQVSHYLGQNLYVALLPILFGIVVGTFSSTYVAAALLLYLPAVGGKSETKTEEATA